MKNIKSYVKLVITGIFFLSLTTACSSDDDELTQQKQVEMDIPSTLSMTYGEQKEISLPANVLDASDIKLNLDFSQNENIKINNTEFLKDKLSKAITIDKVSGKVMLNSTLLYANGVVSVVNGTRLPENYKITIDASSEKQNFKSTKTIEVKITPAKLTVKGLDNKSAISVAYVIYGEKTNFELESSLKVDADMNWGIENQSALGTVVSLNTNVIKFADNAGDPDKKVEKTYDVNSALLKDGFPVATTTLRVIFIPKIKFFFGTYYPEYDLTVLTNNVYIGLSNGYVSAAPTLSPETYKSSFVITGIKKNGQSFTDTESLFSINDKTGSITLKKSTTLTRGAYEITVKAITTTGLEFFTTLTLNMESLEE
ncbi:hypothetical protein SAMN05443634_101118 [Chishuiella changwenlii]|uniref:DUF1735 domain-containing protein n=2 Tax=Chishuiella changwenlii TaxID=1434701 RepID=A0A1M6STG5_9FLAO|nr:hypothetical protein [Chishuiella changwenlii]SHK48032.1 hypothetical protein SAMN05443634_101118 [Chishuiella changwenlii]